MKKASQLVLLGIFALFGLTQFTNCDGYQTPSTLDGASTTSCTNASCVTENPNNLMVTPHIDNGEYGVTAGLSEFNLGGDCNEGGYLNNVIHWDLLLNGRIVRSSNMQIATGLTAESRCINGRFLIYVTLAPLTINNADPYNRTGLLTETGVRSAYNLHITIMVNDATTGAAQQYQTNVPLSAL